MNVFVAPRQGGKSTWCVERCADLCDKGYDARIVCVNRVAARHLLLIADKLDRYISEPITACDLAQTLRDRCIDDPKQLLILDELTYLPKATVALAFSEFVVWGFTINKEEK